MSYKNRKHPLEELSPEEDAKLAQEIAEHAKGALDIVARHNEKAEVTDLFPMPKPQKKTKTHPRKTRANTPPKRVGVNGLRIGRPPGTSGPEYGHYERSESIAQMVSLFVAMGVPHRVVAQRFNLSYESLIKYYRPEVLHGRELNEMFWIGSLANAARKGKVDAIKFALERKFGWVEKSVVTINDGESGIIFSGDRPTAIDITPDAQEGPAHPAAIRDPDDKEEV
jgi:hypothetical protein